jgi:hypothetical protein
MATNFPTSLDAFTNPTAVDTLDSPPHDVQHADANDAIEALQAKVGVDGSAVTDSLDYKVANFTNKLGSGAAVRTLGSFVGGDVLQAAELNAIGTWTAFTPTWTNLTVGNGTLVAEYCAVNELVFWRVLLSFGSTTSISGSVTIDYPVPADNLFLGSVGGQVYCDDQSGADYFGTLYRNSTTTATVRAFSLGTTYLASSTITATVPFTWGDGDDLVIEDWYKPA